MDDTNWTFAQIDADNAQGYFDANGFVGFNDLISAAEHRRLVNAVERATDEGKLVVGAAEMAKIELRGTGGKLANLFDQFKPARHGN